MENIKYRIVKKTYADGNIFYYPEYCIMYPLTDEEWCSVGKNGDGWNNMSSALSDITNHKDEIKKTIIIKEEIIEL